MSSVPLAICVLYLVACLIIGILPGSKASDSAEGYVAGDRKLGPLVMYFITGATLFSAFAFLGMPGWAYSKGVAACYVLGYGILGFLPFYFLGPRAARVGRAYGLVTQAEMVARRFDSRALAGLMAIVSVYALVPYVAIQMQGAGYVLNVVSEGRISRDVGAAIVYGVVLIYVLRSGVLGVGWTNTFQGILMMSMAWVIGLYVPWKLYGGVSEMFTAIGEAKPELLRAPGLLSPTTDEGGVLVRGGPGSWVTYTSQVVVSIIGFTCWPQLFMRAFNAKDERTLRRTVVLYPTFQLFLLPLLFLGFTAVLYALPPGQSDQVVPHMLTQMDLPGIVVGLFIAGALAASMSSGDAIIHTAASVFVRDGMVTCLGAKPAPRQERTWIRRVILLVVVSAYGLAVSYKGSLVGLLLYAYGPIAQFGPVLVATLYWRGATRSGVLAGLLAGSATSLAFVTVWTTPFGLHAGLLGLVVNVPALLIVSRLTRQAEKTEGEAFLVCAQTPGP